MEDNEITYCPFNGKECNKNVCAMTLKEKQTKKQVCAFTIIANELAKIRIDTYIIGERLKDQNKRLDRHNELLQFIAENVAK
ncbi:hypothetical protein DW918_06185 [Eubacterium ventriosum]|jgi:hypothetical protein|uniref:Uncharacterized protein n=1 Tax=Eubacterium ventriosum TaxID=39496 RepID=A0A413T6P0_9FIRM|nr:hypothetical protein DW918_06185 [Eubacterium ventriosum]